MICLKNLHTLSVARSTRFVPYPSFLNMSFLISIPRLENDIWIHGYNMKNTSQYYTRTAQMLHWLMAAIFIAAWCIGFYSGNFLSYDVDGSFKGQVITLHKNIATTIIFLVMIRIFWRYTHPVPALPDSMSPLMKTFAHLGHFAFISHVTCPTHYRLSI